MLRNKKLLPKMKALCHDFNFEVRKAITSKISNLFNLLDTKEECDKHMHSIIIELLDDEEAEVKNLAIEGFLDNIDRFTDDNIQENLIDVIMNLISEISGDDNNVFLHKLDDAIEHSLFLRKLFLTPDGWEKESESFHNKILFKSSRFIDTLGADIFFERFYDKYVTLLKSEETKTESEKTAKLNITADIHEVVRKLGTIQGYQHDFEKHIHFLINDKSLVIKGRLLENLHVIIEVLSVEELTDEMIDLGLEKKINTFKANFMKNFIKMEETLRNNWRYLNMWIDGAYRIILKMHEVDPPSSGKIDGTASMLKKFIPIIFNNLKKGAKLTRELGIMFVGKLMPINATFSFRKDVYELASSLPYATGSFKRIIYLEFLQEAVNYGSKKLFCMNFLDSYYMLSKDKGLNVIIKFGQITPAVFKKVSYDDARNKERILNIIKSMKEQYLEGKS